MSRPGPTGQSAALEDALLENEEAWFDSMVTLGLNLVKSRLRSLLFHLEGPGLFAASMADIEQCYTRALAKLQSFYDAYAEAKRKGAKSMWASKMLRQTWLSWPAVDDFMSLLAGEAFVEFPDALVSKVKACFSVGNTKIIEDFFNKARHAEQHGQANNIVSNRRLWATAIQRKTLSEVHDHTEIL